MLAQFHASASAAQTSASINAISATLWKAHASGALSDEAAQAVAEALEARRKALAAKPSPSPSSKSPKALHPRSPDRQRSIERRRRLAASGTVPCRIAAHYTLGEQAVLTVIARQCQQSGVCSLPIDAIAALAGVCRSTVQNTLRLAREGVHLIVRERRRKGLPSLSNLITIASSEWRTWLKLGNPRGGFKKINTTNNQGHNPPRTTLDKPRVDPPSGPPFASIGHRRL